LRSRLKVYLKGFEANCGITDIHTSNPVMLEIYERIEKRRVYFHIFYNGCKMGELNEGSLMCFWILKLMPFTHPNIPANELNAKIALYLLNNMLLYYAKKNKKRVNISDPLSKEAIMVLAESMII
jgi:hypothetical protein